MDKEKLYGSAQMKLKENGFFFHFMITPDSQSPHDDFFKTNFG